MNYKSVLNLSVFVYSAIFNMFLACTWLSSRKSFMYNTVKYWLYICVTHKLTVGL